MATKLERATRMPRDQRRAQLLDAANEVFTTKGYHAAAMDDIADAAGISKPVLYQHFGSKLDLYLALLDISCDRLVEVVEEAVDSTDVNAEITFRKDAGGQVTGLTLRMGGSDLPAQKVK